MRSVRPLTKKPDTCAEIIVRYDGVEHVAVLTLNRPRALNAINGPLSRALGEALRRADADDEIRAIVLTGAGRAFCAGADLKAVAAGEELSDTDHPEWGVAGFVRHWVGKPIIAAVNGLALGGGAELVLACDLAVADEKATLGLPEVTRGLVAGAGGLIRLPQQIPRKIALEVALTGTQLSAHRAAQLGLVNHVAPAGDALRVALELAARIAANAPLAVRESKALIHQAAAADWGDDIWARNDAVMKAVFASADAQEGPRAFAEKRPPAWLGR
jgi:enoyl-CoA hydratase/carnithine racemase